MTERCEYCDEELVLKYDEMKGDEASCAACGYGYRECDYCGNQVGENDWENGVEMCKYCWEAILDNNP